MTTPGINTVGIAGAGTMGQGIAISCALAGYTTILFDVNTQVVFKALDAITHSLKQSVVKGKLAEKEMTEALHRIHTIDQLAQLKADLIIEAIIENIEIKRSLFADLELINSPNTIFASNTSSISITQIADELKKPNRFVGLHFFNPAHIMKLVEVISGSATSHEAADLMKRFSISLGKTPVDVKDSPGFIVNRVARHFYVESLRLLEEEEATFEVIDKLLRSSGFKMGPFELMDLIGIDVNYAVTTSVYEGFGNDPKFKPSEIQRKKIEEGMLGRKTGRGFYEYEKK